jgi:hypothetical protein
MSPPAASPVYPQQNTQISRTGASAPGWVGRSTRGQGPYLILRDPLGSLFTDADFGDLYLKRGHPAYAPSSPPRIRSKPTMV